jgi:hypothetical protein
MALVMRMRHVTRCRKLCRPLSCYLFLLFKMPYTYTGYELHAYKKSPFWYHPRGVFADYNWHLSVDGRINVMKCTNANQHLRNTNHYIIANNSQVFSKCYFIHRRFRLQREEQ